MSFEAAAERVRAGEDPSEAAQSLIDQLSDSEVIDLLDGDAPFWPGITDMTGGGYYTHAWPAARNARLGIPGFAFTDGPRGVVIGNATCFPVAMARAATFDLELEEAIGEVIGIEARAAGATYFGGVCVNLLRHPAWGRAQETYGEDPYQLGEFGAALTRGVQRHVLACVKHFACNSMENARFTVDVTADDRALHEVYLPHFRRVVEAGVASVMSSYNSLNGEWCGQSRPLLTEVLRDEWGFDGFIITDFIFGFRDAVASVHAGLDVEMPFAQQRARELRVALEHGELNRANIDAPATRVVATLLRFAELLAAPRPPVSVMASDEHRALARRAAQESIVLLTNRDELLPIDATALRRVAVLGSLAAVPNLGDGGSSAVHPPSVVTPLDGLRAALADAEVVHSDSDLSTAADADLVVVVVGYTKADEGEYIGTTTPELFALFPPIDDPMLGRAASMPVLPPAPPALELAPEEASMATGGDRRTLRLSRADEELIHRAVRANPRTVVVVMSGSAVVMPWVDAPAATLLLWYPGMEGGHALADVLFGVVAPSGRLPFAIPRDEADLVTFDPDATSETYDLFHGQWYLDRTGVGAAFPFGFGLSTTTFSLAAFDVDVDDAANRARVEVANSGPRTGAAVVQIYAGYQRSAYVRPQSRLVGFTRVELAPGETAAVEIPIDLRMLDVRVDGAMWREPGVVELRAAFNAADPGLTTTVSV